MLDATVISLSLSRFDRAKYRQKKGAIKLHVPLDYDGCLPGYVNHPGAFHEPAANCTRRRNGYKSR